TSAAPDSGERCGDAARAPTDCRGNDEGMNAAGLDVVRPACRGTAPWMPPPFQAGVRTGERQRGARAAAEVRPTGTDTGSARSTPGAAVASTSVCPGADG